MDRKDNLSDNPVGIRDRLRQNPAAAAPSPAPAPEPVPEPSATFAPEPSVTPDIPEPAATPVAAPARREHDARRAVSDLAARLARESAAMLAESQNLSERARRLAELAALYQKQLQALDEVTPEKCGAFFPKTVDNCRLEYFRLAGEAETLRRPDGSAPGGTAKNSPLTARDLRRALWIPALAMIAAGLAVAAAMFAVFH